MIAILKQHLSFRDFKKPAAVLIPIISRHRINYIGLLIITIIDIALTLVYAWFIGAITDAAVQGDYRQLKWLVPAGIVLIGSSIAAGYCYQIFEFKATAHVKKDLKEQLLKHVILLPAKEIDNLRSGAVMTHFTQDIHGIDGIIGGSLIQLVKLPLIFFAVFILN